MLRILTYPDPFLREVSDPVETIDDSIRKLAEEMIETMYAAKGVGLAAPQVGHHLRLFIVDLDPEKRDPRVLINPEFLRRSKEKSVEDEGCLSVPGITARVKRPEAVTVKALDLDGNEVEYSGGGLLGRALQHENDHLDGMLFIDKVSTAARLALRGELAHLEQDYLDPAE